MARALAGQSRPRILEAGCGARSHLTYPSGARVFGVDLLRSQLLRHEPSATRLSQGDVTALP